MHKIIDMEDRKKPKGYANGVVASGTILYVGGQIGWNKDQVFESHEFIGQMEQCLKNIVDVIVSAGGEITDLVRMTWYVTDKADYLDKQSEVGAVYQKIIGRHFPAMTMVVVADLVEDKALLEIEATAVLSN